MKNGWISHWEGPSLLLRYLLGSGVLHVYTGTVMDPSAATGVPTTLRLETTGTPTSWNVGSSLSFASPL
jgi:hypothetical protein